MTLELHVWSPAFDLPSIDPQCLAAIAYLSCISQQPNSQLQWQIIPSNDPSISPTKELPALHNTSTNTTIGGLPNITSYLRTLNPTWDLDLPLLNNPLASSDQTAFLTHISTRGNILLALSLFVSTENYTTVTRPTYSSTLPFPSQYLIPPTLRTKARHLTAHLGLSSPDLDDNNNEDPSTNKSIIPDSLRTLNPTSQPPKSLKETLAHHQTNTHFRLSALVDDFCAPLSSLLTHQPQPHPYLLSPTHPTTLDPLATAYLNLLLLPPLPQSWLRTRLRTRWPELAAYAARTGEEFFGAGDAAAVTATATDVQARVELPWQLPPAQNVVARTISALATTYLPLSPILIDDSTSPSSPSALPSTTHDLSPPAAQAHALPTVLLTASALAAGLTTVVGGYLLVPYLSSSESGRGEEGKRRGLSEMGEAGLILASVFEGESTGVRGGGVGVGVEERVDL